MDASPLCRLPAELRNRIYGLVLALALPIVIGPSSQHDQRPKTLWLITWSPNIFALVKTCKQVHSESNLMIYADNTFEFSDWVKPEQSLQCFNDFVHLIGSTNAAALRTAQFVVDGSKQRTSCEKASLSTLAAIKRMSTAMPDCTFHLTFARLEMGMDEVVWLYLTFKDDKTFESSRKTAAARIEEWRQRRLKNTDLDWFDQVDPISVYVEGYAWFLEKACAEEGPE